MPPSSPSTRASPAPMPGVSWWRGWARRRCSPATAQLGALRTQQDGIEQRIAQLRAQKAQLPEDDYYNRFEQVALEMARLGQRIDARLAQLGVQAGGSNETR